MVQKIIEISLLQFIDKVLPYVVAQRQIPTALRGPRQFFMPVACRQFWGPDVQKTVVLRSCSSRQSGHARCCDDRCMDVQFSNMVDMPVVATTGAVLEQGGNARYCDDRCIWFHSAENCEGSAVAVLVDVCCAVPKIFYMADMAAMNMAVWFGVGGAFFGGIDAIFRAPPVSF